MNTDFPLPNRVTSNALVPYDPNLPHVSLSAHLENFVDKVFIKAMKLTMYETEHLSPVLPLKDRRLCQILPSLTGPHMIGRSSLVLDIPEDYSSEHGSNKKIGIEIFAPTNKAIGNKLLMQMRPGYSAGAPLNEQQIQTLHTHALDLDRLDLVENLPILIFSHGLGVDPIIYRPLIEELASNGFAVLNLNHPASSNNAPFSPDAADWCALDELFSSSPEKSDEAVEKMASTQAANIEFVVSQIQASRLSKLPVNCGPKSKVVLAGHSLGGASSIMASRGDSEIAGCINLDGRLTGSAKTKCDGLKMPLLLLCSEPDDKESEGEVKMAQEFDAFRKNSSHSKYIQKMIPGVRHMDFTMNPMLEWLVGGTGVNGGLKAHMAASQEILDFMKAINSTT
jgi:dienelactone hydrolase